MYISVRLTIFASLFLLGVTLSAGSASAAVALGSNFFIYNPGQSYSYYYNPTYTRPQYSPYYNPYNYNRFNNYRMNPSYDPRSFDNRSSGSGDYYSQYRDWWRKDRNQ